MEFNPALRVTTSCFSGLIPTFESMNQIKNFKVVDKQPHQQPKINSSEQDSIFTLRKEYPDHFKNLPSSDKKLYLHTLAEENRSEELEDFQYLQSVFEDLKRSIEGLDVKIRVDKPNIPEDQVEKLFKICSDLFQRAPASSIHEVTIQPMVILKEDSMLLDSIVPIPSFIEASLNLAQLIPRFNNLTHFHFICPTSFNLKTESQLILIASKLFNLKTLVLIGMPLSNDEKKSSYVTPNRQSAYRSMGKRLASLKSLKHLHLQGLQTPDVNWSTLNWKSQLLILKIVNCPRLHNVQAWRLAECFQKTLQKFHLGPELSSFNGSGDEVLNRYQSLSEDFGLRFISLQYLDLCDYQLPRQAFKLFSHLPVLQDLHLQVSNSNQTVRLISDTLKRHQHQNWKLLESLTLSTTSKKPIKSVIQNAHFEFKINHLNHLHPIDYNPILIFSS